MDFNEETYIANLSRIPFGLELAKEVARKLQFPDPAVALKLKSRGHMSGLYAIGREPYGHQIWFDGMNFVWGTADFILSSTDPLVDATEKSLQVIMKWSNVEAFVKFLSQQSDFSCSGADPNSKEFFCRRPLGTDPFTKKMVYHAVYNQPITRERLEQFIKHY
jgi:hypothetical protein